MMAHSLQGKALLPHLVDEHFTNPDSVYTRSIAECLELHAVLHQAEEHRGPLGAAADEELGLGLHTTDVRSSTDGRLLGHLLTEGGVPLVFIPEHTAEAIIWGWGH